MYNKTKGIILKKTNYTKADVIVTCFTKDKGKKNLLARGLRKRKAKLKATLHPLRVSELITVEGKNFTVITRAQLIKEFSELEKSFYFQGLALYLAEIIDQLFWEPEPPGGLFKKTERVLGTWNAYARKENKKEQKKAQALLVWLVANFLQELGFSPQTQKCAECGKKVRPAGDKNIFSTKAGGVICDNCKKGQPEEKIKKISAGEIRKLETISRKLPTKIKTNQLRAVYPLKRIIFPFLYEVLRKKPSTQSLLEPNPESSRFYY